MQMVQYAQMRIFKKKNFSKNWQYAIAPANGNRLAGAVSPQYVPRGEEHLGWRPNRIERQLNRL